GRLLVQMIVGDQDRDRTADHFDGVVAEYARRTLVPAGDDTVQVLAYDGVLRRLDDCHQMLRDVRSLSRGFSAVRRDASQEAFAHRARRRSRSGRNVLRGGRQIHSHSFGLSTYACSANPMTLEPDRRSSPPRAILSPKGNASPRGLFPPSSL